VIGFTTYEWVCVFLWGLLKDSPAILDEVKKDSQFKFFFLSSSNTKNFMNKKWKKLDSTLAPIPSKLNAKSLVTCVLYP
jgi:hypothetical protein